ncbi:MAG: shikimate dehydrogenase [Candidatus Margulisbacteria bacterium GWF2_35_9]|nr:MAG: shikimate dehydrogenase [Candidatus Margulisbacteria bacterium GWF2_35_9]
MSKNKYAVIGYPLGYSLSPLMHNHFFKKEGIDASYISLPIKTEDLKKMVDTGEYAGFNVTIPHKESILPYLTKVTEAAQTIGAVNTVKKTATGYIGTNTDGDGFLLMLKHEKNLSLNDKNIVLYGAGGAAKAICYGAIKSGAKSLYIYDPDQQKVESLVSKSKYDLRYNIIRFLKDPQTMLPQTDIVINATPIGMEKTINESVLNLSELKLLPKHAYVIDIIYAPLQTQLLKLANSIGLQTINGIGMLAGQGVLAEDYWFNKSLPYEEAKTLLLNGL